MSSQVLLSVQGLCKTFEGQGYEVKALSNVSFDLKQGEMPAVMGTSGSGKSTLLNILGALDEPDKGTISLNGEGNHKIFSEPYSTEYRRNNIGFIFQSFNLLKDLTVEENVALPLILKGSKEQEMAMKIKMMLDLVGLTQWKSHYPVQLSGGQQQRVAIARALITSPPIVLADEPTGNLDYNTSLEILDVLIEMKERLNQSIIIVTHDPMVASYADRVLFFHDGKIVDSYQCMNEQQDMDQILFKFKTILEKTK